MINIPVYPQELNDGIGHLVKANASVSYISPLAQPKHTWPDNIFDNVRNVMSTKAKREIDKIDLFPIEAVLVTTGWWNKNRDIFVKDYVWPARASAEDKPFNFGHNQLDIIGHITGNVCVDENFIAIADDTQLDDVPDKFHIITNAVIYRVWEDKVRRNHIEKLIAEIQDGDKWYVSMECIFSDFDYGIMSKSGETRIIPRNKETAGLTKFLRQYGGSGVIEGEYEIGRYLKNIVFCGKGLVENPANPESIIINNTKIFKSVSTNLGYINLYRGSNNNEDKGKSIMPDKSLETGVAELKTFDIENSPLVKTLKEQINTLTVANTKLEDSVKESNTKAIAEITKASETKISSLESQIKDLTDSLSVANTTIADLNKTNTDLISNVESLKASLTKVEAEKVLTERVSALIAAGAPEVDARSTAEKFVNLDSNQFSAILDFAKEKWSGKDEKKDMKEDCPATATSDDDDDDTSTAEAVVDQAKASNKDASLGVDHVDNGFEVLRASMVSWYDSRVRKNQKNS